MMVTINNTYNFFLLSIQRGIGVIISGVKSSYIDLLLNKTETANSDVDRLENLFGYRP